MSLLAEINDNASSQYRSYVAENPHEQTVGDVVLLYGQDYIEERNDTYGVQDYLPQWFAIGDDGGGRALLMRLDGSSEVYLCDHGALGSAEPKPVAFSFRKWLIDGCELPGDEEPESELPLHGNLWLVASPVGGLKDLLALKKLLRIEISLGDLKQSTESVPCVLARDVPCIALARRARERPDLADCISFSESGSTRPQFRVT